MKFTQITWYSKLLALILFVALPFIGFYLGTEYQKRVTVPPVQIIDNGTSIDNKSTIDASKFKINTSLKNGVFQYSGSVELPSPCHQLRDESVVLETFPEQIQIRIGVFESASDKACVQVITTKEFKGEFKVSNQAKISIYFNGKKWGD